MDHNEFNLESDLIDPMVIFFKKISRRNKVLSRMIASESVANKVERYTKKTWQGSQRNQPSKEGENVEESKEETKTEQTDKKENSGERTKSDPEIKNPYIDELDKKKKKLRKCEIRTKNFEIEIKEDKKQPEDDNQPKMPKILSMNEESKDSELPLDSSRTLAKKLPNHPP